MGGKCRCGLPINIQFELSPFVTIKPLSDIEYRQLMKTERVRCNGPERKKRNDNLYELFSEEIILYYSNMLVLKCDQCANKNIRFDFLILIFLILNWIVLKKFL